MNVIMLIDVMLRQRRKVHKYLEFLAKGTLSELVFRYHGASSSQSASDYVICQEAKQNHDFYMIKRIVSSLMLADICQPIIVTCTVNGEI